MKKILLSIFVLATFLQTFAKAETAMIGMVDGMVCIECQKKVTKELKVATGQEDIVVSWPDGVAIVNFDGETNFTEEDFKNIITKAGFKVGKVAQVEEKIQDPETGLLTYSKKSFSNQFH